MTPESPPQNGPGGRFRQRCVSQGVRAVSLLLPGGPAAVPLPAWLDLVAGALDERDEREGDGDDDDTPDGDVAQYVAMRRWIRFGPLSWSRGSDAPAQRWGSLYLDLAGPDDDPIVVWDEPEEQLRVVLGPTDHVMASLRLPADDN
mgnify:CR=1 FL=1